MASPAFTRARSGAGAKTLNPTPPTSTMRAFSSTWVISPRRVAIMFVFYRNKSIGGWVTQPPTRSISVCVQMGDRNGQCVCSVIWLGYRVKLQQGTYHFLNLFFICRAISCHSLFHFIRCLFKGFDPCLLQSKHDHSAGLPNLVTSRYISREE